MSDSHRAADDPRLVETLRDLRRRGARAADLLRVLAGRDLDGLEMMSCLREAFGISLLAASDARGWQADGTGPLGDDEINRRLDPAIDASLLRQTGRRQVSDAD